MAESAVPFLRVGGNTGLSILQADRPWKGGKNRMRERRLSLYFWPLNCVVRGGGHDRGADDDVVGVGGGGSSVGGGTLPWHDPTYTYFFGYDPLNFRESFHRKQTIDSIRERLKVTAFPGSSFPSLAAPAGSRLTRWYVYAAQIANVGFVDVDRKAVSDAVTRDTLFIHGSSTAGGSQKFAGAVPANAVRAG